MHTDYIQTLKSSIQCLLSCVQYSTVDIIFGLHMTFKQLLFLLPLSKIVDDFSKKLD